jgi:hypothetical protein
MVRYIGLGIAALHNICSSFSAGGGKGDLVAEREPFREGIAIALHGSWDRTRKTGYKLSFSRGRTERARMPAGRVRRNPEPKRAQNGEPWRQKRRIRASGAEAIPESWLERLAMREFITEINMGPTFVMDESTGVSRWRIVWARSPKANDSSRKDGSASIHRVHWRR